MFCPHCGKEVAEDQVFCQHCGSRIDEQAPGPAVGGRSATPWEERRTLGFYPSLFKTIRDILFHPTEFFQKMPVTGGLTDPLLFGLIIGSIGMMFQYLWDVMLHDSMRTFMTTEMQRAAEQGTMGGISSSIGMVLIPFLVMVWLFVVAGTYHVVLSMVRGVKAGFEATFRVVGYSMAPFLFMIVPYCGGGITLLWVMTLAIIGLREAHETTGGKAGLAVLFPFLFCCGMVVLMFALFMGVLAASFGSMMHR